MSTSFAQMEIGRVALTVNDIDRMGAFYQAAIGLDLLRSDGETALFGAGDRVLLELRSDRAARRATPREAGLFHTAFLLPGRSDLSSWFQHAVDSRLTLAGASDHRVSEAIYLSDPEGNGIEVYADRPRDTWRLNGSTIEMGSDALDLNGLAAAAKAPWAGAPDGTVVGHVHLQVGGTAAAEAFYGDALGFALTNRYPGASFFGSGGYHHHLGANDWNSRGAGPRQYPATGLADVQILADAGELAAVRARNGGKTVLADPWGTALTFTGKTG